jgi:hypothetical protein
MILDSFFSFAPDGFGHAVMERRGQPTFALLRVKEVRHQSFWRLVMSM